jgi:hypothetical protein
MQQMRLSDEELAQTLQRAEQIAQQAPRGRGLEEKYEAYLKATDEMGIPREAVVQALREKLNIRDMTVEPGTRVFAPSADGYWYMATVKTVTDDRVSVRFEAGGEHTCDVDELKPASLLPGTIVHACWKGDDVWYGARIRKYDAEKKKVEVIYRADGTVESLPLDRIRLFASSAEVSKMPFQWVPQPLLDLALKLAAGGAIGFLVAWWLG